MASPVPWYCRYGIHGDIAKHINVDGTAIYRVRERPCDCTPPQPPRRPRPASAATPHVWPPPQPPPLQRRTPGRGQRVVSVGRTAEGPGRAPVGSAVDARAVYPLPAHPPAPPPYAVPLPSFDSSGDARLRVVVPPLSLNSAVGDGYAGYVAAAGTTTSSSGSGVAVGSAVPLPTIPVIPPLSAAAVDGPYGVGGGVEGAGTAAVAPLATRPADPLSVPPVPLPLPPPQLAPTVAGAVDPLGAVPLPVYHPPVPLPPLPSGPPPPAAAAAPPALPCTVESHAVDRLCGFVYCPTCGARVAPEGGPGAAAFTPATCPQGPHGTSGDTSGGAGDGGASDGAAADTARPPAALSMGRYCFLCGADSLQAPTPAETAATTAAAEPAAAAPTAAPSPQPAAAAAPAGTAAGPVPVPSPTTAPPGGDPQPAPPPQAADAPTAPSAAADPACDVAQDLYTVEQIMEHLLRNAAANGGRVRPPCGLPHCRLCHPFAASTAPPPPSAPAATWTCACPSSRWAASGPVMCGSPAIAIIHNHFAR